MSFFSNNPFYDMLERATSENIPGAEEDIVLNLDIADLIKSKKISAADAVTAFKKKLENTNPNVQLLTIKLLDCCIKNSGNHFLAKVSQREIVDSMATIIRSSITNPELKRVALTYFQNWAIAFRTKPDLYYLPNVYNELKMEGHRFPAYTQSDVSGFLIDTETAPEWSDSSVCQRCRTNFTTFNRKHHCRKCGLTFCNDCCNKRIPLPSLGLTNPERVCESCYYKINNPSYNTPKQSNQNPDNSFDFNDSEFYVSDYIDNFDSSHRHDAVSSKEEDDIKRAIELSLKEAENNNHSRNNSSIKRSRTFTAEEVPENSDEEEEQVRKAIEASLKEIRISDNNNTISSGSDSNIASSNPDELLTTEIENIKLFSQLMEKISAEAPIKGLQAINDTQIQALHVQISSLHPKVMKNKNYYEEKYKKFNDIHEKLIVAKRLYDQILSQRLDAVRPGSTSTYPNLYQPISTVPVQPQAQPQTHPQVQSQQRYSYTPYSLPPNGMAQPAVASREGSVDPTTQPAYINPYPSYLPSSSQPQPAMNYGQVPVSTVPPTQPQAVQVPPPQQPTQPIPGQPQPQLQPQLQPQPQQPTMIPGQPMPQPQVAGQPPAQDMNLVNKPPVSYTNEYPPSNVPYVPPQQPPYLSMQPNAAPETQQPPYAMPPAPVVAQPHQVQQAPPPPEPVEEKPLIEL